MKLSHSILLAALSISSLIVPQKVQANLFRMNIDETGGDVVFSFDGSIDLTGATIYMPVPPNPMSFLIRNRFRSGGTATNRSISIAGSNSTGSAYGWNFSTGVTLPEFGTNDNTLGPLESEGSYTVTGSGDVFLMQGDYLRLPKTYNSGDTITGQMTFANSTLNSLDITPGTYSYTLGNNNMEIVATPGPLPILGLPVIFLYYKRFKDKSKFIGGAKGAPIGASNSKL